MATLFTKIAKGEIPGKIVYKDETCFAIQDINPQAPVHLLLIPHQELPSVDHAKPKDQALLGHLMLKAAEIARQQGLSPKGYRLVINIGDNGGQTVPHLHIHILGGRALSWPPG